MTLSIISPLRIIRPSKMIISIMTLSVMTVRIMIRNIVTPNI
jgi:hypothetical protein